MIVAQAGLPHRITVATNMAGRGTDIVLGGDPQQLLLLLLARDHNASVLQANSECVREALLKNTDEQVAAAAEVQVSLGPPFILISLQYMMDIVLRRINIGMSAMHLT